ncbi:MAG: hypothetical protein AAGI23_06410 [Bacteroidota bacterium]
MRPITYFLLLLLLCNINGCQQPKDIQFLDLRDDIRVANLASLGYERVIGVDVFMFAKEVEDTVTCFQFDDLQQAATWQSWIVKIQDTSRQSIESLVGWSTLFVDEGTHWIRHYPTNAVLRSYINVDSMEFHISHNVVDYSRKPFSVEDWEWAEEVEQ